MADEPLDLIAWHRAAYLRAVWTEHPAEAEHHARIIDRLTRPDHAAIEREQP